MPTGHWTLTLPLPGLPSSMTSRVPLLPPEMPFWRGSAQRCVSWEGGIPSFTGSGTSDRSLVPSPPTLLPWGREAESTVEPGDSMGGGGPLS